MEQQENTYTPTDLKNVGFSTAIYTGVVIALFICLCLMVRRVSMESAKDAYDEASKVYKQARDKAYEARDKACGEALEAYRKATDKVST